MKTKVFPASTRGAADHGWLQARFSFSFAEFHDPDRMGFGLLRVLNDDRIAPGKGFGEHPHRDMEIVTIPLAGALRHKDSMGNEGVIRKGEIQRMSAGKGVFHSEFNDSETEPAKVLQTWVFPREKGIAPGYEQKRFDLSERKNRFHVTVSPGGENGAIDIHQDAYFALADIESGKEAVYQVHTPGNGVYFFLISGAVSVAGETLGPRDAVGVEGASDIRAAATESAEILAIEVPMQ